MLATGSSHGVLWLASGSPPPNNLRHKPCAESKPYEPAHHRWSWTKNRQGARVELRTGEWDHRWLAHELNNHGLVTQVQPEQSKLKNTRASDHESDTNYSCWLSEPASGGNSFVWKATMGYSRHKDLPGDTHGWVQFGKGCTTEKKGKRLHS